MALALVICMYFALIGGPLYTLYALGRYLLMLRRQRNSKYSMTSYKKMELDDASGAFIGSGIVTALIWGLYWILM